MLYTVFQNSPTGYNLLYVESAKQGSVKGRESDDDLSTWSETEPSDLSGERLLDTPLSPLPVQHSCPSPPVHTSSGLLLNWRPHSWGAMPSICQQGDCFSALEILAWKINVAAGLRHPSSRHTGPEGVRSGSSPRLPVVCLGRDRTLWNHSSHWQAGFSLQPEPDKANEPGWYS